MEPGKLYWADRRELLYEGSGMLVDVWPDQVVLFIGKEVVVEESDGVYFDKEFRYTFLARGKRCSRKIAEEFEGQFERQFTRVQGVE